MMNGMNAFERSIKKSLDGFEVPYNSADWAQMEQALSGARAGKFWGTAGFYAALLAGLLAVGSGAYMLTRPTIDPLARKGAAGPERQETVMPASPGSNEVVVTENSTPTALDDAAGMAQTQEKTAMSNDAGTSPGTDVGSTRTNSPIVNGGAGDTRNTQKKGDMPKDPATPEKKVGAFVASISEGCEGTAVEFHVQNMPENGIYLWNFGDGKFDNKPNPSHTFHKPGKFTVTLSMSTPGKGTITNEPYADLIVIHEVPEAAFNATRIEHAGHVPSVHFENRSHGGVKYDWDFGDGTTSNVAHPDHVYREKGVYKVTLRATNDMGCEDMIEKDVRIDNDYNLLAPSAFSPNSDGNEDYFMPQALKELDVKFHMSVFEPRTGRLVYETSDASKPWTGRLMNTGSLCAPGQYVWMVEIHEGLHLGEITYEGKVSLVN